jgi:general stress protein 26
VGTVISIQDLLAAARQVTAQCEYCWAVTTSVDGTTSARVMGQLPSRPGEDEWTKWFLINPHSRKAREIERSGHMSVAFGNATLTRYAVLKGRAVLVVGDRSVIDGHWQQRWDSLFARGKEDPNVAFIKLEPDQMEICLEGMQRYAVVVRGSDRGWTIAPE